MSEGFGARLRNQREGRQIDLGWIADETKIKRSLLEGLERDDVSRWPSGIFRRAYVRTYAQIIGLDPDVVLREFLELHPEPVDELEAAAAAAAEEAARRGGAAPGTRLRTIVDSAIGSLARLRRPGAIDGSLPSAPPRARPAQAVAGPAPAAPQFRTPARTDPDPPVAMHGSAASLENAPELEDPPPEPVSPWDVRNPPQFERSSGIESAPRLELAPELEPDPGPPLPSPDLMLAADDDWIQQATSTDDLEVDLKPDAPSDARRPRVDSQLEAVATLCTEVGRAGARDQVLMLLEDAARALDATGLIVWLWAESADGLRPVLVHGYSEQVLAHLPTVRRDADNATAEAFRTARPCEVTPSAHATGALVVPLLIPEGCAGVLAVELQPRGEAPGSVRPLATLLAAALAQFVHRSRPLAAGRTRAALRSQGRSVSDT